MVAPWRVEKGSEDAEDEEKSTVFELMPKEKLAGMTMPMPW